MDRLEQRMADVEDSVDPTMATDLLDDLAHQVGELALMVPTQEDLLDLRLHTARVATDLARLATELQAGLDRLVRATSDELDAVNARVAALGDAVDDLVDQHQVVDGPRRVANHG
jgi:hypothetical protein